ncbi:MAG: hypothetical protein GTO45_29160 [Candidatus Aminicenantes bacterium]|nr:hypothetical protein [Candidatus Aminicenantes bacterium]NIM82862.1 hypothetical protein [Candidatus Aminicenantes bacterium]NIN22238.1 hypothetical protein [Candidatus Aminicenantes bacterium]NIN46006.1 hypothetical protein [Candidatus Aminicenantes bacterium]NIN88842.1 hypothetical protein [Candidatus Aminicenantes bacterium]
MSQITLGNLLESRFGKGTAGNVLKGINDAYRKGKKVKCMSNAKKSVLDESGIVNGFFYPIVFPQ